MKIYSNAYDYAIHILKIIMKSIMKINAWLDISLFAHFKYKGKYIITVRIPKLLLKNIFFFSSQSIRMSGNSINFNDKKIGKNDFYKNKNKKIFNVDDINVSKILVSKLTVWRKECT